MKNNKQKSTSGMRVKSAVKAGPTAVEYRH